MVEPYIAVIYTVVGIFAGVVIFLLCRWLCK